MTETTLVVDGSNIATEGRSVPSLQQLDEAVTAFIAERPHDVVIVVVDATFGHRIDPSELPRFEEAVLDGELVTPPAGAIERMCAGVAGEEGAVCLLTGGAAERIAPCLGIPCRMEETLVLDGLLRYAQAED